MAASAEQPTRSGSAADLGPEVKAWRAQLRWALQERYDDPARAWLEILALDMKSKRGVEVVPEGDVRAELLKFRTKIETQMAAIAEELGDETLAPLYSWLDLMRERGLIVGRLKTALASVKQARASRGAPAVAPEREEKAAEELTKTATAVADWTKAMPPDVPQKIADSWREQGGEALHATYTWEPKEWREVQRAGDLARRTLAEVPEDRGVGTSTYVRSRAELIGAPVALAFALLTSAFAGAYSSRSSSMANGFVVVAALGWVALAAFVAVGVAARARMAAEKQSAMAWMRERAFVEEQLRAMELEAGWLRALHDAQKELRGYDATAGTGGKLQELEAWRPDLKELVIELTKDQSVADM